MSGTERTRHKGRRLRLGTDRGQSRL